MILAIIILLVIKAIFWKKMPWYIYLSPLIINAVGLAAIYIYSLFFPLNY